MLTEGDMVQSKVIRRKYRWWKKVDPEDLDMIDRFYDAGMAEVRIEGLAMYAKVY